jgi:predicted enzyme related to lactoylglutathione lyase
MSDNGPVNQSSAATTRARWCVAPFFLVDDVVRTANFYRDKLGFQYDRFWGDPPCFCMVHRAGITIMLNQTDKASVMRPNRMVAPSGEAWDAYVWVDDADALYEEFKGKGVKIARNICDKPYGCRDFDIEDFNGYRLCFGHDLGSD